MEQRVAQPGVDLGDPPDHVDQELVQPVVEDPLPRALDDFGAGFSSFYYLKYLPLDYLKIDGDFIRSLTSSVTDQLVVKSMVDIARGLGMKTIAEFVEASETVDMLREKGVDYSQGYFHGAPRPVASEFVALNASR